MAEDWSASEVAATVADYLAMLTSELRGEAYSKRDHNRQLQAMLNNRSAGAIEFKHANISAVLIELGFPYIDGYKPRGNYQELLKTEVIARLDASSETTAAAEAIIAAPAAPVALVESLDVFVDPPSREPPSATYERRKPTFTPRRINYLEREARNASLGAAGERFVLEAEHRRLWDAGHRHLAERIEHVAATQGDGHGYDIVSYELDGRERLIEVKTTSFGAMTPFFASAKEVAVSEAREEFYLYRVFKFRDRPRVFWLQGSLRLSCVLDPVQFRAALP
jgi:hypothetical protein